MLPTGGGKSVCYQIPALAQEGVCIVISPLLALMQDQVESLLRKDIKAIALNKPISQDETIVLFDNIQFNNIKFLYLSPEKLQTAFIQEKIKQLNVSLIAIDEAHCISEWGHDFRPSYLELNILKELCPSANTIALTASATPKVLEDIALQLEIETPEIFQKSFKRDNLAYQIFEVEDKIFKIKQILTKIKAPTILYTNTRNDTKRISDILNKQGFSSTYYHGGLTFSDKQKAYTNWFSEKTPIIVATNAFGMGIDKSNIRVVIHLKIPNSIENYLQEAGRAGRDGKKAFAVMLLQKNDISLFKKNHKEQEVTIDFLKKIYFQLNQYYTISKGELPLEEFVFQINEFCSSYKLPYTQTHNALKTLATHQIVAFTEGLQKKTSIQFIISSNNVLNYCDQYQSLNTFVTTILRTYGGVFENTIILNEYSLSKTLNIPHKQVLLNLIKLEKDEIIRYTPASKTAKIRFLVPRDDDRTINAISKALSRLQHNKDFKASAIVDFVENDTTCRSIQLLNYFEEKEKIACGICDSCLSKSGKITKPHSNLKIQIIHLIKLKKEITSREIVLNLNQHKEDEILSLLSSLLEDGKISLTKNNSLTIHNN